MCDRLTIEICDAQFDTLCMGSSQEDALSLLQERVSIKPGDIVTLTNGIKGVVMENRVQDSLLRIATPEMGEEYDVRTAVRDVIYMVIESDIHGVLVHYEDYIRLEGTGILHSLIADKQWAAADNLMNKLISISVDVSEFADSLADIAAGVAEDEARHAEAEAIGAGFLEHLKNFGRGASL